MKKIFSDILASPKKREGVLYLLVSTSLLFILMRSALHDANTIKSDGDLSYFLFVLVNTFIYAVPATLAFVVGALGVGIFLEEAGKKIDQQEKAD